MGDLDYSRATAVASPAPGIDRATDMLFKVMQQRAKEAQDAELRRHQVTMETAQNKRLENENTRLQNQEHRDASLEVDRTNKMMNDLVKELGTYAAEGEAGKQKIEARVKSTQVYDRKTGKPVPLGFRWDPEGKPVVTAPPNTTVTPPTTAAGPDAPLAGPAAPGLGPVGPTSPGMGPIPEGPTQPPPVGPNGAPVPAEGPPSLSADGKLVAPGESTAAAAPAPEPPADTRFAGVSRIFNAAKQVNRKGGDGKLQEALATIRPPAEAAPPAGGPATIAALQRVGAVPPGGGAPAPEASGAPLGVDAGAAARGPLRNRRFTVTGPNGIEYSFDTDTARYAAGKQNAEDLVTGMGPSLQAQLAHAQQVAALNPASGAAMVAEAREKLALLPLIAKQVEIAGMSKLEGMAMLGKDAGQIRKELVDWNKQGRAIDAKHQDVRTMANRPVAGVVPGAPAFADKVIGKWQTERKRFEDRVGIGKDTVGFQNLLAQMTNVQGDNQALQSAATFGIARSINGVGPLTDKDLERIRIQGGYLESLEQLKNDIDNNRLTDKAKARLTAATQKLMKDKIGQAIQEQENFARTYYNPADPFFQQLGPDFMDNEQDKLFGIFGLPPIKGGMYGAPPKAGAKPAGKGGGKRPAPAPARAAAPGLMTADQAEQDLKDLGVE